MKNRPWETFFEEEEQKNYYHTLIDKVDIEYKTHKCLPIRENIFLSLKLVNYEDVNIVVLGQDPYPNSEHAMGLAFSSKQESKIPKSLLNIFIELENDLNKKRTNPDLTDWAKQGMLLFNTTWTLREGESLSHKDLGWKDFSINLIKYLNKKDKPILFWLLGKKAQEMIEYIDQNKHTVFSYPHPSPLSCYRGFFGSKIFSRTNTWLTSNNYKPYKWDN